MDLGNNIQNNTANDNNDGEDHQEVEDFRDMLSKETNRMTSLCDYWESKISSISEDQSYEEIRGEVRKYDFNMFQNPDILIL